MDAFLRTELALIIDFSAISMLSCFLVLRRTIDEYSAIFNVSSQP